MKPQSDSQIPEPILAPTVCPFCGSSKITTTSAKVESSSYWRCGTCGDVWNVDRLQASNRHHSNHSYYSR